MDVLETPYDDEVVSEYIDCTICNKSIRGQALYKIHVTTVGHTKKEESMIARGHAIQRHDVPLFDEIKEYIRYLKIDEPIIGLSFLREVPRELTDLQPGPRYLCTLCDMDANMPHMIQHVIGRKHRQKYMQLKRPDLVNWDKTNMSSQPGKSIRARAEIIERQDGQGIPKPMKKNRTEGYSDITKVGPKQNVRHNVPRTLNPRDLPPLLPGLKGNRDEYAHGRRSLDSQHFRSFCTDEPYMPGTLRQSYPQDHPPDSHLMDERGRGGYSRHDIHRREIMEPDYHRQYEERNEEHERMFQPGVSLHSMNEMPQSQRRNEAKYPEDPLFRRPYPDNNDVQFLSDEVGHGRVNSGEYEPSRPIYPEEKTSEWVLDKESDRHATMRGTGWQGRTEPEAEGRKYPSSVESERFIMVTDYGHKMRGPYEEEPSRTGPRTNQIPLSISRNISNIPEPFRQFLQGPSNNSNHGPSKRKAPFSDASAEEIQRTSEMQRDEFGPPNLKYHNPPPAGVPSNLEGWVIQNPGIYTDSEEPHLTGTYQRGGSKPFSESTANKEGVFDILRNVEIENAEQADFLKNKLSSVLEEFNAKKSEKDMQNIRERVVKTYDLHAAPQHHHNNPTFVDGFEGRREDAYFNEAPRERGWTHQVETPGEHRQGYQHVQDKPKRLRRSRFDEDFGAPEMSQAPRSDEQAHYPPRFQAPMQSRDSQPPDERFDPYSSTPPSHMEREHGMHRRPQHSTSLDKITSTLLKLVARK
ncbi:uncharacterized protein si:ch211-13c6.2 isoform X2 [Thalassophryne amazonica]|uniref:uncharacterized protein si:ch211-13c6.2 isoform X2 n=1 Tax=Thalassophryne amazonica TaxID=390379 RepID=UPI0014715DC0|nr:uncharacterized protein si:ch211-13c6.2 isoform X2 [Thalassophryne amazonica]